MAGLVIHRSPSVGSVTKKLIAINPDLSAQDLIAIVKDSTQRQGDEAGDFSGAEFINEEKALAIARATLEPAARSS